MDECALDELIVIPAGIQPFKQEHPPAPGEHRLNMARLAFNGCGNISVSDIELIKGGVSYTIDTLKEIKKRRDDAAAIFFILGSDMFLKIEKWKGAGELLREFSFIIGTRPGCRRDELDAFTAYLKKNFGTDMTEINNKQVPVSSTEIKAMIGAGNGCGGQLPPEVEKYIDDNGLYS